MKRNPHPRELDARDSRDLSKVFEGVGMMAAFVLAVICVVCILVACNPPAGPR